MTGTELKQIRQKHNLTQKEFAAMLYMPFRTYQDREYGVTPIRAGFELLIKMIDKELTKCH